MEHIASIVGSIAWPTVAVLIIFLVFGEFGPDLHDLIGRVDSFRWGASHATFRPQLESVAQYRLATKTTREDMDASSSILTSWPDEYMKNHPQDAILKAWEAVANAGWSLFYRHPELFDSVQTESAMFDEAAKAGLIHHLFYREIGILSTIKDHIQRGYYPVIGLEDVRAYVLRALALADALYDVPPGWDLEPQGRR